METTQILAAVPACDAGEPVDLELGTNRNRLGTQVILPGGRALAMNRVLSGNHPAMDHQRWTLLYSVGQ
jgi:hypothetical protein